MPMSMKRFILLAICLFSLSFTYANEVVRVRKAVGRWEVSDDITPKQAEEKAFNEAKKEALRMAGVMENVWSVFGQVTADNGTEFTEAYSSVSMLAISGMVNVSDKKVEDFWDEGLKRNFKVVTIDALVTKDETQEDKAYALDVKGIEPIYKQMEVLECSFKVYGTDSYLKIFWFGDGGADMIYPNDYDPNQLFKVGETYKFPVSGAYDLSMEKSDPKADVERVNIIMVATKKEYLYNGDNDYQSILTWIYNIPADQRALFHTLTLIR